MVSYDRGLLSKISGNLKTNLSQRKYGKQSTEKLSDDMEKILKEYNDSAIGINKVVTLCQFMPKLTSAVYLSFTTSIMNDAKRTVEKQQKKKAQYSNIQFTYDKELKHLQNQIDDDQESLQQKKRDIEKLSDINENLKGQSKKLKKETEKKEGEIEILNETLENYAKKITEIKLKISEEAKKKKGCCALI